MKLSQKYHTTILSVRWKCQKETTNVFLCSVIFSTRIWSTQDREIIGCNEILTHVAICPYQKATTVTGSNTKNCGVQQHTSVGNARTQYIWSAKHDQQNKAKHGIYKGFKQRKRPSRSLITASLDFLLLVLHCNRVCILYWFHDVVT